MKVLIVVAALLVPAVAWADAWVLVCPPPGDPPDTEAPIVKWKQHSAYDSAAACEGKRVSLAETIANSPADTEETRTARANNIAYALACRCMPYELWWRTQQPSR